MTMPIQIVNLKAWKLLTRSLVECTPMSVNQLSDETKLSQASIRREIPKWAASSQTFVDSVADSQCEI